MKVELQNGDRITIPEGCRAQINGNEVVIEKEEKEEVQEFKEGDVLVSVHNGCMVIFEKYNSAWSFKSHYNEGYDKDAYFNNGAFRHATEEEKQLLFAKMKEQGLRWNAEEKRVEKVRWRAKKGENYFLLNRITFEVDHYYECFDEVDAKLYKYGNYFRTREQAEEAARRVKETLRKYHEETGE